MAEPFDPYVEWLGLRAASRPLSYYQLLSLDDFEDDPQRIVTAADAALARVRGVRPGAERAAWQKLLDELLLAKLCLLDPARKLQLDEQLYQQQYEQLDQQFAQQAKARAGAAPAGNSAQPLVEPKRVDPDLFPPGMGGPPPAGNPPPTVVPGPFAHIVPPPAPPPSVYAAPPDYAPPPAILPPVAPAPPTAPQHPTGWAGWPMPASVLPAATPPQPVASKAVVSWPVAGHPQPATPLARGTNPAETIVEPELRPAPAQTAARPPIKSPAQAPTKAPAKPVQPAAVDPQPTMRPTGPQPVQISKPINAPVPLMPYVEPMSGKRPVQPQNQLGLAIGAGLLAIVALAVIILKPPSGSEDEPKSQPSVAARPRGGDESTLQPAEPPPSEHDDSAQPAENESPAEKPTKPMPNTTKAPRPKSRPGTKPGPTSDEVAMAQSAGGGSDTSSSPAADPAKSQAFHTALAEVRSAPGCAGNGASQAKAQSGRTPGPDRRRP